MADAILGGKSSEGGDGEQEDPLMSAADDLISAVHSKDASGVMEALRSAFTMLESQPHDEGGESPTE
jgi:hypothetical protein